MCLFNGKCTWLRHLQYEAPWQLGEKCKFQITLTLMIVMMKFMRNPFYLFIPSAWKRLAKRREKIPSYINVIKIIIFEEKTKTSRVWSRGRKKIVWRFLLNRIFFSCWIALGRISRLNSWMKSGNGQRNENRSPV